MTLTYERNWRKNLHEKKLGKQSSPIGAMNISYLELQAII